MQYRAPSWAWASLDAGITYTSQRIKSLGDVLPVMATPRISLCHPIKDFNFIEVPLNASRRIRGQVVQGKFQYLMTKHVKMDDCKKQLYYGEGDAMGLFYPDIKLEVQHLTKISCLSVCGEIYGSEDLNNEDKELEEYSERVTGIALVPVPGDWTASFKRVGLLRWMKRPAFKTVGWSDMNIV